MPTKTVHQLPIIAGGNITDLDEILMYDGDTLVSGRITMSDLAAYTSTGASAVTSVNTQMGAVVLDGNDIETTTGSGLSVTTGLNTLTAALTATENHLIASGMSTGITFGGEVTVNANLTSIDVAAGHGHILDNFTDPDNPVLTDVNWATQNVPLTNIATADSTTLYVDINGVIQQLPTAPSNALFRDDVLLAGVAHPNRTTVTGLAERKVQGANIAPNVHDIFEAVGRLNLEGNVFSAGGADLTLARTAGEILDYGVNYANDKRNPNVVTTAAAQPANFIYALSDGSIINPAATDIDPTKWDDNGTLTSVQNKKWTIHHLYVTSTGQNVVMPGQAYYKDFEKAKASVGVDPHVLDSVFADVVVLRATLITKHNCTDLTNTDEALFSVVNKFGNVSAGGSTVGSMDDLNDVSALTPTLGDILQFTGTEWVNSTDYISLTSLKAEVAASADFAAFQTAIAAL